ncbi:MAG: chromosome segregation protein SMC [Chloroflexi bacterium]|nr:chromosome segregation protein SMC [Chloroflexota bacterium]
MYLRKLELHGFKTFAQRTEITFAAGLTAIVGPNGSGKSNVADAIRWVLGEQSLRLLRCKKSEDVVFSGGAGRPPAGFAEVALWLENGAGWLDTPYTEVVVTRRVHRSGEGEYLLNGNRIRLRDLTDLLLRAGLSTSGNTVIGQGMVDQALTLRPEERRTLLDEAAGIRHHQTRLADARQRLAHTESSLSRARDVITEIEPRLRLLERRTRQLRERDSVRQDLRAQAIALYSHRWYEADLALRGLEEAEGRAADEVESARRERALALEGTEELIARQRYLRDRLVEIDRVRAELTTRRDAARRDAAVRRERADGARERAIDLREEVEDLRERGRTDEESAAEALGTLDRLTDDIEALTRELGAAEQEHLTRQERLTALSTQLASAMATAERVRNERDRVAAEFARLEERRTTIVAEMGRAEAALARDRDQIGEAERERVALGASLEEARAEVERCDTEIEAARGIVAAAREKQERAAPRAAEIARRRAVAQGRLDLLTDARDGYAGYYAGVRAVMAAARDGASPQLSGIVGLVASLIEVRPDLEVAIEVALGSHLQDIVVARWGDAEAAVEHLKRTQGGRATFLPLDSLRVHAGRADAPDGAGILGVAADLVQYQDAYSAVAEHLLGRTLVVEDLATARGARLSVLPGWQIVTRDGEIVRPVGSVTGGSRDAADRTLLARERERRELPRQVSDLAAAAEAIAAEIEAARRDQTGAEATTAACQSRRRARELAQAGLREQIAVARARLERLEREQQFASDGIERGRAELADVERRSQVLRVRLAGFPAATEGAKAITERLRSRLAELRSAIAEQGERVAQFRSSVALAEGERRAQTALIDRMAGRRIELEGAINDRLANVDGIVEATVRVYGELDAVESAIVAMEDQIGSLEAERRPVELEIGAIEDEIRRVQRREGEERTELERLVDRARESAVEAGEARERIRSLAQEARLLLEEVDAEQAELDAEVRSGVPGEGSTVELPLSVDPSDLPAWGIHPQAATDPSALRRRVDQLRARLRSIGAVDGAVTQEYDEVYGRHAFLSGQTADLTEASRHLRDLIDELERTIARQFDGAFAAVAEAFRRHFVHLFGGGTARLVLTAAEDGAPPGVEIVAQPPGKRAQSLSLLSGGERALTAAAILFAILEVNPTPICVLDEVDAALDDANIVRFASTLRSLSERTQFIIITHNRGTMEAVDALYGITMQDRSISRTMSLRLADLPAPA